MNKDVTLPGNYSETLSAISKVIAYGDLKSLSEEGRMKYYAAVCDSAGLNPLTRPFEFIEMNGRLVMYAKKDCTEQLRKIHGVSCEKLEHKKEDGLYMVIATVRDKDGRTDMATGAIAIGQNSKGADLAILIMKTETKAKRRATLSLCGLGILDETEIEDIRSPLNVTPQNVKPINPDDYKLLNQTQQQELATEEQIKRIKELSIKLGKNEEYLKKVSKSNCGSEDISKVPREKAEDWIKFLEEKDFVKSMEAEKHE